MFHQFSLTWRNTHERTQKKELIVNNHYKRANMLDNNTSIQFAPFAVHECSLFFFQCSRYLFAACIVTLHTQCVKYHVAFSHSTRCTSSDGWKYTILWLEWINVCCHQFVYNMRHTECLNMIDCMTLGSKRKPTAHNNAIKQTKKSSTAQNSWYRESDAEL